MPVNSPFLQGERRCLDGGSRAESRRTAARASFAMPCNDSLIARLQRLEVAARLRFKRVFGGHDDGEQIGALRCCRRRRSGATSGAVHRTTRLQPRHGDETRPARGVSTFGCADSRVDEVIWTDLGHHVAGAVVRPSGSNTSAVTFRSFSSIRGTRPWVLTSSSPRGFGLGRLVESNPGRARRPACSRSTAGRRTWPSIVDDPGLG